VIAPGSFNDVQLGNNDNSYTTLTSSGTTGYFNTSYTSQSSIYNVGVYMTPTGQGYSAMAGYDLASGLGTPNGTLLARALTAIAHSQVSFGTSPAMLDSDGHGGWVSGTDQNLLFQATTPSTSEGVGVAFGGHGVGFASGEPGSYSWSARLAQQSLQPDFDPGLAVLFDKQAQGSVMQSDVHQHEAVSVSIGTAAGQATQAGLSNPFGFDDFFAGSDAVRLARPVAIAETVGGQSDQMAVVRLRQVGSDTLSVCLYRVDNLQGAIGDKLPGDAAYAAAAEGRAYQTISGATPIAGPGYGQFEATAIQHVNAGDMVALKLINNTTGFTFFGFAQANEVFGGQHVAHLWNYGLNTWGFEDTYGGGDHDFNDMIVQVDFTSASGHGWLV
jgi:hypothetical protein